MQSLRQMVQVHKNIYLFFDKELESQFKKEAETSIK
jgi:hypothetical protein